MVCSQESAGQVCSAGPCLLGSVPPPPLPCCVVLSSSSEPTYLCHQQPLLSLLGGAEVRDTRRKGWEINAKITQLSRSESRHKALSPGTKPTLGCRGFCLLPAHQLSSNVKIYTNMCFLHSPPKAETTSKNGLGQRSVIRQGRPCLRFPGSRHKPSSLCPSQGKGLGEHPLVL